MIVAEILKPQGIKGEVKVSPFASDLNIFFDLKKVVIDKNVFHIKNVRIHEGFVFLSFEEFSDRNFAENLRGKMIEVNKEDLKPLKQDFYYFEDLVGCEVFFEDGEKVGKIKSVENFGASDILVLKSGSEEILIPFLKKILVNVDTLNKKILLNREKFLEVTESED